MSKVWKYCEKIHKGVKKEKKNTTNLFININFFLILHKKKIENIPVLTKIRGFVD